MRLKPIGVLLAGGRSSRMKVIFTSGIQDKSLLRLGSDFLIAHIIERVQSQVDKLIINVNQNTKHFTRFGFPIVSDTVGEFSGPLAGILAGMEWTKKNAPNTSHILSVPTDVPFLPLDLVDRLEEGIKICDETLVLARSKNIIHPVIGLWPTSLSSKLEQALKLGTRKVLHWTMGQKTIYVDFPLHKIKEKSVDPFFNINTPSDLKIAQELIE